jgi:hypothetical protein
MKYILLSIMGFLIFSTSCRQRVTNLNYGNPDKKVIFLHHSTGNNVWYGDLLLTKQKLFGRDTCQVPRLLKKYNDKIGINISIEEQYFPKGNPYPWQNDPYDYYNIWVKNAGNTPYMEEPTLELLTEKYDLIIFKHCFPVSNILEDDSVADVNSSKRTLSNYKLQYSALKEKLLSFPSSKFIIWTATALVESQTNEAEALRAREFAYWVKNEWDQPFDNIYIFDFRELETGGGLYLKPEYASGVSDSHPNSILSSLAAKSLVEKIIEVINE